MRAIITVLVAICLSIGFAQPNIDWEQDYGSEIADECYDMIRTHENGYLLIGYQHDGREWPTGANCKVIKTDSLGNVIWNQDYAAENLDSLGGYFKCGTQTIDECYILAGTRFTTHPGIYQSYMIKIDGEGNIQWEYSIVRNGPSAFYDVVVSEDGNIYLAGSSGYLTKTDSDGNIIIDADIDIQGNGFDRILLLQDGNLLLAALNPDIILIKIDNDCDPLWTRNLQLNYGMMDIIQTSDDCFICAGYYGGEQGIENAAVKFDNRGNVVWTRNWRYRRSFEYLRSITELNDGSYILGGIGCINPNELPYTFLQRFDNNFQNQWTLSFEEFSSSPRAILANSSGSYIIAGTKTMVLEDDTENRQMWLCNTNTDTLAISISQIPALANNFEIHNVYPNPFNSTTTISFILPTLSPVSVSVYNTRGQLVDVLLDGVMPVGSHKVVWDGHNVGAGVYFLKLCDKTGGENFIYQKVTLIK